MKSRTKISFSQSLLRNVGFEIIKLSDLVSPDRDNLNYNPFLPHRLDHFALMVIEEGFVNHMVDFKNYRLETGECLLISKDQIYAFDANSTHEGILIMFTEEFLNTHFTLDTFQKISSLFSNFVFPPKIENRSESLRLMKNIDLFVHSAHTPDKENILGALLSIFFLRVKEDLNLSQEKNIIKKFELFMKFRSLVKSRYAHSRNAQFYARELGVSYKRLNNISKATINQTAKAFIDNYVMLEAKRMLITNNYSIKETAYHCGFDEPTNFTKFFKKHTKKTPLVFKSEYSQITLLPLF